MKKSVGHPQLCAAGTALLILLAACGGEAATTTASGLPAAPGSTSGAVQTTEPEAVTAATPPAVTEDCQEPATEISMGTPIADSVDMGESFTEDLFFCVQVPVGVATISIELTGLTADLNLYVGYPDLATVQQGGFSFWSSDRPDSNDEMVLIEPALYRGDLGNFEQYEYVNPGPYYIEVSSPDGRGASPFTLTVSVP